MRYNQLAAISNYDLCQLKNATRLSRGSLRWLLLQTGNCRRQLDAKVFMTAGPFAGQGVLRGLFVIAANSPEEAKAIAEADPLVKAGQLSVALHTWWVAKEVWP